MTQVLTYDITCDMCHPFPKLTRTIFQGWAVCPTCMKNIATNKSMSGGWTEALNNLRRNTTIWKAAWKLEPSVFSVDDYLKLTNCRMCCYREPSYYMNGVEVCSVCCPETGPESFPYETAEVHLAQIHSTWRLRWGINNHYVIE